MAVFDGGHRVVALGQAGDEGDVAFVGLVDVCNGAAGQPVINAQHQVVAGGDLLEDGAQRGAVVAVLFAGADGLAELGAAGAHGDAVGGA